MGRYNINAKFLGPDSTLYPFKNSTFDELAAEYIPVINKLHPESKIRDLFEKGKDFNIPGQGLRDGLAPSSAFEKFIAPASIETLSVRRPLPSLSRRKSSVRIRPRTGVLVPLALFQSIRDDLAIG